MRLGAVWSVGQDPNVPYYGSGVNQGTFGGNDYCGAVGAYRVGIATASTAGACAATCSGTSASAPREVDVYLR